MSFTLPETNIRWVPKHTVLAAHRAEMESGGGSFFHHDDNKLEMALMKPQNLVHYTGTTDIGSLSAAYCAGIIHLHPFIDGNKRTAFITANMFMMLQFRLEGSNLIYVDFSASSEDIESAMKAVAAKSLSEEELAAWFKKYITIGRMDVNFDDLSIFDEPD